MPLCTSQQGRAASHRAHARPGVQSRPCSPCATVGCRSPHQAQETCAHACKHSAAYDRLGLPHLARAAACSSSMVISSCPWPCCRVAALGAVLRTCGVWGMYVSARVGKHNASPEGGSAETGGVPGGPGVMNACVRARGNLQSLGPSQTLLGWWGRWFVLGEG